MGLVARDLRGRRQSSATRRAAIAPAPAPDPKPLLVSAATHRSATRATRRRIRSTTLQLLVVDAMSTMLAVVVGATVFVAASGQSVSGQILVVAVGLMVTSIAIHGQYRSNGLRMAPTGIPVLATVLRSLPLAMLGLVGVALAMESGGGLRAFATATLLLPAIVIVPVVRAAVGRLDLRHGVARRQRVLVVGAGEIGERLTSRLERYGGITVVGTVDDEAPPGYPTIGSLADIAELCRSKSIDRLIVALPSASLVGMSTLLQPLMGTVDIAVVPAEYELLSWRSRVADLSGIPMIPLVATQHSAVARWGKRSLDLVLGSVALVLALPVLAVAAIAIKTTSKGPAFFLQRRGGRDGQPFTMFKLRTMEVGAETRRSELFAQRDADGPRFKMAGDPRVTRVGAFLRRYSIDELPQLLNVLAGQMSLVGPRPFPVVESDALQVSAPPRFAVLPGMTGLWQVSGRSDLSWDELCNLDTLYASSWSMLWDLRILLQTPLATLRQAGAY